MRRTLTICDRCEKEHNYRGGRITPVLESESKHAKRAPVTLTHDLCDECIDALNAWVDPVWGNENYDAKRLEAWITHVLWLLESDKTASRLTVVQNAALDLRAALNGSQLPPAMADSTPPSDRPA